MYSIATICEQLTSDRQMDSGWFKILATDRNEQVLNRARKGCYPSGALQELKDEEINKYFQKLGDGGQDDYQVDERLKEQVEFEKRDIQDLFPDQSFDLILCRNLVFTYFTEERQKKFLERLKSHLTDGGYFVIGSNESIPETNPKPMG